MVRARTSPSRSSKNETSGASFSKEAGRKPGCSNSPSGGACSHTRARRAASLAGWALGLEDTVGRAGESGAAFELIERGPVRVVLRVKSGFRDSTFEQELTLYRGLPRRHCAP